ncbi:MAG TPA: hypothetical protein VMW79_08050 [Anaerolineae bacterium]|nr:hypothetical protein [Anaerolineae bacterium]
MKGWMYLKVEIDDIDLCHTFHPKMSCWTGKTEDLTRQDFHREVATFIKKAEAMFDLSDVLKEAE